MLRRLEVNGNPFIGVFCAANEDLLLVDRATPKNAMRSIGEALGVRAIPTTVAGSTVIGSLVAMNSNGILASAFVEESELETIRAPVYPLPHRLSAVGNNVLCNDRGAVVHPGYDDDAIAFISEALGVPVTRGTIAGVKTVGAVAVATNKGVLCHPHARPTEMELLREALHVPVAITTANYGSALVGACMVANSKGAVVGSKTTPIELGRIEEGLGYF